MSAWFRGLEALGLGLTAALAVSLTGCAQGEPAQTAQYVAVIDAGSSGSRLNLYLVGDETVDPIELDSSKTDVPLASFASNPSAAGAEAIQPLLEPLHAYAIAEEIDDSSIVVNVLSTAGMRKVDESAAAQIYTSVDETITESGFTLGATETISGDDEALYAWVDANSLNGSLGIENEPAIGIVEIGGASAQVAFALDPASTEQHPNVIEVTFSGVTYPVFTHSYLGLGQNDARSQMADTTDADTSCFANAEADAPTVQASDASTFVATEADFNYEVCATAYEGVIVDKAKDAPLSQLSLIPGFTETLFYGLSSIAFVVSDFDVSPTETQETFTPAVITECTGENAWQNFEDLYPLEQQAFAVNACANGTYISTFLRDLGIENDKLVADADIQGQSPTWTQGFVLLDRFGQTKR